MQSQEEQRVIQVLQDRIAAVKAENATLQADDSDSLPAPRNRKMSLQGTGNENKSLAEVSMGRKKSVAAVSTEEVIRQAAAEDKPALLLESMRQQWRNKADMEIEYASWALSCVAELCQGNEAARTLLLELGAVELVLDYMECKAAPNLADDIFTQWQGTQAIGNFCCDQQTADRFGPRGLSAVIRPLQNTDISELGQTSMRALKQLLSNSAKLMAQAKKDSVDDTIMQLVGSFPELLQLQFTGTELAKAIRESAN
jgi:hypothetical protein